MTSTFIEIPAIKRNISKRKRIYGIGINDVTYQIRPTIDGNEMICPFYAVWTNMLARCYCKQNQKRHPTYFGCTVSDDWFIFSNFKHWMQSQDWKDKELDKDLLIKGNKHYSSNTCVFISKRVNNLLNTQKTQRGKYKLGVSWNKKAKGFEAQCRNGITKVYLGIHGTEQDAHKIYCTYKANLIIDLAKEEIDLRIVNALIERANSIHLIG